MPPTLDQHHLDRLFVGNRLLVNPAGDQRIVDVGNRHQARRERDGVAGEALGIAAAVPTLMVAIGDLGGVLQEGCVGDAAERAFGLQDSVTPVFAMLLHQDPLVGRELARLEEDRVRRGHLAHIVERRRFEEQLNHLVVELVAEAGVILQGLGKNAHIVLGAADVIAGLVVAGFGEGTEGGDGSRLGGDHLLLAADQAAGLGADFGGTFGHQQFEVGVAPLERPSGPGQGQVGAHPRPYDRRRNRLVDEVFGAQLQPPLLVLRAVKPGEEENRNGARGFGRLEPAAHLVAVDLGHHHVQQDQVGAPAPVQVTQRLSAVDGRVHVIDIRQCIFEYQQIVGLIVDDQYVGALLHVLLSYPFINFISCRFPRSSGKPGPGRHPRRTTNLRSAGRGASRWLCSTASRPLRRPMPIR